MGRELILNRIDFLKNKDIIIRDYDDTYICGRTDFTNRLAGLFYSDKVDYLIVDYDLSPIDGKEKIHVKTEDKYWDEKEFDMEFGYVKLKTLLEICDEGIEKDNKEIYREQSMMEDARAARKNVKTIEQFEKFSDLIDELQDHIDSYFEEAKTFKKDIYKILNDISLQNNEEIEKSYLLFILSE